MPDTLTAARTSRPAFIACLGQFDRDAEGPLYLRLKQVLRDAIRTRVVAPEDALPPERELAEELNLSRITVRKAIDGLVEEGLLTRRRGSGTFVASRVDKSFARLTSFSEDVIARGHTPGTTWLSRARGVVTPEEALCLGLSPGTAVYRFQRLRRTDGAIMALEHAVVPAFCLPSPEAVDESLYAALEATGYRPVRALQRLRGVALTAYQAEKLGVRPGEAGLFIERRSFSADGRSCELTHSWYRGDAYDVVAELSDPS